MSRFNISVHRDYSRYVAANERPIRRTRAEIDANRPASALPQWLLLVAAFVALAILAQLFSTNDVFSANNAWRLLRFWR